MSFSFSAGGTKAQTLDSLAKAPTSHDQAAATIADLLSQMVGAGPDETSDGKPVIYQATADGHSSKQGADDWPSIDVTLSGPPGPAHGRLTRPACGQPAGRMKSVLGGRVAALCCCTSMAWLSKMMSSMLSEIVKLSGVASGEQGAS